MLELGPYLFWCLSSFLSLLASIFTWDEIIYHSNYLSLLPEYNSTSCHNEKVYESTWIFEQIGLLSFFFCVT